MRLLPTQSTVTTIFVILVYATVIASAQSLFRIREPDEITYLSMSDSAEAAFAQVSRICRKLEKRASSKNGFLIAICRFFRP
ncbi:hypothetical protein Tcan_13150 [Toxocara canis]|uniref:Uncharacterized protein n=1 Tax=Toxocara canis TaxID=6265 RepID=A0A0B2VYA6_TOXCA|nr:hypothetical protein Tcan_13150 [Toxocara canis]